MGGPDSHMGGPGDLDGREDQALHDDSSPLSWRSPGGKKRHDDSSLLLGTYIAKIHTHIWELGLNRCGLLQFG